jgi:hypothetical protein
LKVKELIRQLQEADPTGELEACVGNIDVHFVCRDPAYYDGPLQVLKRDPDRKGVYDICAAEFRRDGHKVQIHTLSIKDAIWEDPDLPVECPIAAVDEWRHDAKASE